MIGKGRHMAPFAFYLPKFTNYIRYLFIPPDTARPSASVRCTSNSTTMPRRLNTIHLPSDDS